jgi:protein O-mannosyl-transferase
MSANDKPKAFFPALALAIILLATALSYLPVLGNGFTNWDDTWHVVEYVHEEIAGQGAAGLKRIFTDWDTFDMYIPLVVLSWTAEHALVGLDPWLYHLDNLLLHLVSTVLVFFLFRSITRQLELALIVAALFGVSTINVEAVAWISGRKDLLYAVFSLGALNAYVRYKRGGQRSRYLLALALFLLALLSKAQSCTLPLALLVVDGLLTAYGADATPKVGSRPFVRSMVDKAPFFVLALGFGVLAIYAVSHNPTYVKSDYPIGQRALFACQSLVEYLAKSVVPYGLSAVYPYPIQEGEPTPASLVAFAGLAAVLLSIVLVAFFRARRVALGLVFYLVSIFPMLQLFSNSNLLMGDHYTYFASLGIYYVLALGLTALVERLPRLAIVLRTLLICWLAALCAATSQRSAVWKDSVTLWDDALAQYPASFEALEKRGRAKLELGDTLGALVDFERTLAAEPRVAGVEALIGLAHERRGDSAAARLAYEQSIAKNPRWLDAHLGLGRVLARLGLFEQAIASLDRALFIDPNCGEALHYRAMVKLERRDFSGAVADLDLALTLAGPKGFVLFLRGTALLGLGQDGCPDLRRAAAQDIEPAKAALRERCP